MDYRKHSHKILGQLLSAPIIWSVLIPLVILDIWMEIYHRTCFPLYGLPYITRKNYIKIDRHKLKYLKWFEKLGCMYCGYANGLFGYWTQIGGNTEQYWCGIMHKKSDDFMTPHHHTNFTPYNDEASFNKKYHD